MHHGANLRLNGNRQAGSLRQDSPSLSFVVITTPPNTPVQGGRRRLCWTLGWPGKQESCPDKSLYRHRHFARHFIHGEVSARIQFQHIPFSETTNTLRLAYNL
jgi:hypothetical protein